MKINDETVIQDDVPEEHLRMIRRAIVDAQERANANERRMHQLLRRHFGASTPEVCRQFAGVLVKSGAQLVYESDGSATLMVPTASGLVVRLHAGALEGEADA